MYANTHKYTINQKKERIINGKQFHRSEQSSVGYKYWIWIARKLLAYAVVHFDFVLSLFFFVVIIFDWETFTGDTCIMGSAAKKYTQPHRTHRIWTQIPFEETRINGSLTHFFPGWYLICAPFCHYVVLNTCIGVKCFFSLHHTTETMSRVSDIIIKETRTLSR